MTLANFFPPPPEDDSDRKLLSDIATYGWHIVRVFEDAAGPGYSFTVGLMLSYGHPELLVMGLNEELSHKILWTAVGHIMTGTRFEEGGVTDRLIEDHSCRLSAIPVSRYQEYLGYGIWFYRALPNPFPALQIVWPDKDGKFPGDAEYDTRFSALQQVIK